MKLFRPIALMMVFASIGIINTAPIINNRLSMKIEVLWYPDTWTKFCSKRSSILNPYPNSNSTMAISEGAFKCKGWWDLVWKENGKTFWKSYRNTNSNAVHIDRHPVSKRPTLYWKNGSPVEQKNGNVWDK